MFGVLTHSTPDPVCSLIFINLFIKSSMTWQRYNKNLRKSLLLAEYFSFWTINPYSEDIVKAVKDTAGQTLCVLYLCALVCC